MRGRLLIGAFGGRRDEDKLREADRDARREAQRRFDRPLVLEAGAGTGKTTTLIGRLLAWTLGVGWEREVLRRQERETLGAPARGEDDPERIAAGVLGRVVAITFTEAAAAEMAGRMAESLARLARGDEPPSWLDPAVVPPAEERARRAGALLSTLDHLAVRTIHAFCLSLLSGYPVEAGVHPELTVDADGRLLDEVVQETVEASLREGYGDPGDPDLIALAARGLGPREIAEALAVLARAGLPSLALEEDPYAPERPQRMEELRLRLLAATEAVRDLVAPPLTGARRNNNARKIEEGVSALAARLAAGPADLATLRAAAAELLPDNLADHVRSWSAGKLKSPTEERLLGEIREELAAASGGLCRLLSHLEDLDPELLGHARRALAPRLARIEKTLRARGIAPFDALLTGAASLLGRYPEVRARVRRGIDQLLVDEFQDTDRVQCDLLRWIALDGPPEERPGLFLVGDPKQSIYGWRSADLRAYDGFLDRVRQGWGEVRSLVENFRSVPAILDEVARVIEPVMHERSGLQPRFEPLLPCERRKDEPGYGAGDADGHAPVEHWVSWISGEEGEPAKETPAVAAAELEAAALAEDLLGLRRAGERWKDIGILLRGMNDLDVYLEALRRAGVPFVVGRDKQYYRRREIIDAAALVRAVLDPGDHLALLTVLRSPWVGVPDAALIPLWAQHLPKLATELTAPDPEALLRLRDAIGRAARELPADVPGLGLLHRWPESLLAGLEALAVLRRSFATEPADLFLERLRRLTLIETGEAARYLGSYRLANLERFFRQFLLATEDGGGDPGAILRALRKSVAEAQEAEEGRPLDGAEDAVQVMTIHGAKGLDFKHVYLVQLHKEGRDNDKDRTEIGRLESPPDAKTGEPGPVRLEYRLFGAPTPAFDLVAAERREVEAAERVRTLYVAMTRAKDRLVLAGSRALGEDETPRPPQQARSHVDLLNWRRARRPDLEARWREGAWATPDETGALWRLPALRPTPPEPERSAAEEVDLPSPEESARGADLLAARRCEAEIRMLRRFGGAASEEAHELLREQQAERRTSDRPALARDVGNQGGREAAMAAGGAVHRALETWDLSADPAEETERQRSLLPTYLATLAEGEDLDRALVRARALLEAFAAGPLLPRLRALRDHVVARELPVLLPPRGGDGSPVGVVTGTVDLLYRDPATGRLVVADYKTDDLDPGEKTENRAAAYAPQGAVYVRALQEALDLEEEPRFELWFLRAERVV